MWAVESALCDPSIPRTLQTLSLESRATHPMQPAPRTTGTHMPEGGQSPSSHSLLAEPGLLCSFQAPPLSPGCACQLPALWLPLGKGESSRERPTEHEGCNKHGQNLNPGSAALWASDLASHYLRFPFPETGQSHPLPGAAVGSEQGHRHVRTVWFMADCGHSVLQCCHWSWLCLSGSLWAMAVVLYSALPLRPLTPGLQASLAG